MAREPSPDNRPSPRRRTRRALTSVSLRLLRKIVDDNAVSALLSVPLASLSEEEQGVYERVITHYTQHHAMPQMTTMEEWGFSLPDAPEPLGYYQAEVRTNLRMQAGTDLLMELQDALSARDGEALARVMISRREAVVSSGTRMIGLGSMIGNFAARINPVTSLRAITTLGIPAVDAEVGGIPHGSLVILSGRPGSGKTFFQIAGCLAKAAQGELVAVVTKEMSEEQMAHRMIAMHYDFDPRLGIQKRVSTAAFDMMTAALTEALPRALQENLQIVANDSIRTTGDVRAVMEEYRPELLAMDGTYFVQPVGKRSYPSDRERLQDIIRETQQNSQDTNTTTFATWQQNRGGTNDAAEGLYGTDAGTQDAAMLLSIKKVKNHPEMRAMTVDKNRHGGSEGVEMGLTYTFRPTNLGERIPMPDREDTRRTRAGDYVSRTINAASAPGSRGTQPITIPE